MRKPLQPTVLLVIALAIPGGVAALDVPAPSAAGTLRGRVLLEAGAPLQDAAANDVVVYLTGEGLKPHGQAAGSGGSEPQAGLSTLAQKDLTFVPHVLPVLAGSEVEIRNDDETLHNVHTRCSANTPFNVTQLRHKTRRVTFPHPEVVAVSCDIHSQMRAYVVVLENRFFAKPGKDGTYTIGNIPPGKYSLSAWHEKFGTATMPAQVEIVSGRTTEADVSLTKGKKP